MLFSTYDILIHLHSGLGASQCSALISLLNSEFVNRSYLKTAGCIERVEHTRLFCLPVEKCGL